jgi:thiamine pyrophosphate-dependent acetolactate synthase large subunit-like protein
VRRLGSPPNSFYPLFDNGSFGAEIGPRPDYQHYAKAHGGEGFRVTNPQDIKSAIEQALKCENEKKLTVIDMVLSDLNPR